MKLQERLPDSVTVGKRRYKMDFDFRRVLTMMETLARNDLMPEAREYLALKCLMKHPPRDTGPVMTAVKALLFPETKRNADGKKLTSFEQDADLIRAAFRQEYGIDLYRDRVHWIEFSALLNALPEGNRYADVLGIRARPMPAATKYNIAEREWLTKSKAACALQMTDEEREQNYTQCVKNVFAGIMAWAERGSENGV